MMRKSKVDAVVIGSGIGGICAAARLVAAGQDAAADLPQMPLAESLDNAATMDALLRGARRRTVGCGTDGVPVR